MPFSPSIDVMLAGCRMPPLQLEEIDGFGISPAEVKSQPLYG
jgi:hypothetical protein